MPSHPELLGSVQLIAVHRLVVCDLLLLPLVGLELEAKHRVVEALVLDQRLNKLRAGYVPQNSKSQDTSSCRTTRVACLV